MKLDRKINKDGTGKYALINLRTNMIEWGGPGGGFFVIKLHDKFAAPALEAYADAARKEAHRLAVPSPVARKKLSETDMAERTAQAESLYEYAREIDNLVIFARASAQKIPD